MLWILVIVSWGLNLKDGVAVTPIYGYATYKQCTNAAKIADKQHSTYDAYCIPGYIKKQVSLSSR